MNWRSRPVTVPQYHSDRLLQYRLVPAFELLFCISSFTSIFLSNGSGGIAVQRRCGPPYRLFCREHAQLRAKIPALRSVFIPPHWSTRLFTANAIFSVFVCPVRVLELSFLSVGKLLSLPALLPATWRALALSLKNSTFFELLLLHKRPSPHWSQSRR